MVALTTSRLSIPKLIVDDLQDIILDSISDAMVAALEEELVAKSTAKQDTAETDF